MASKEHKIVRRAQALNELSRLSSLLAERFNIEPVDAQPTGRDSELAEIQRIENINGLLSSILQVSEAKSVLEPEKKMLTPKPVKYGAKP
jgi:hypothetical protein